MASSTLVEMAQRGDRGAQEQLLADCRQRIFALAFHLLGSRSEADEACQEALLKIFLRLNELREPGRFMPWAARVAGNLYRDQLRRRKVVSIPFEDLDTLPGPDDPARSVVSIDARNRLRHALARLTQPLRLVLALRDIEGFSTEEVGQALGLPEGTVKSRLFEARRKLREYLAHKGVTSSHDLC